MVRVIDRTRWRKTCQCPDTPGEVSAPPVPRLFPGTAYGISVWARLVFELCVANRPLRRVAAWFAAQGLALSPGTLSDGLGRMVVLFAPLSAAILAHLQQAPVVHADETSWRVRDFAVTGSSSPRLAVDRDLRRCGVPACRCIAQRRRRRDAARRAAQGHGPGMRSLFRLQEAGPAWRRAG